MARTRTQTTDAADTAAEEFPAPVEPTETDAAETPAAEATIEGGDTGPVEAQPAEAEPAPADLTPFVTVVESVVADPNEDGDLSEAQVEQVRAAYRELPTTKDRNRAKTALKDSMKSAMDDKDIVKARAYLALQESMTVAQASSGGGGRTSTPADPTARWRQQLEIAAIAYAELMGQAPEGVNADEAATAAGQVVSDLGDDIAKLRDFNASDDENLEKPEVDARVTSAFRIVTGGKSKARTGGASTYSGERRDLNKHFAEAFASKASGDFMTIAQIRSFKSDEYGDDHPSAGAISARLFPAKGESTVEGVRPGTGGEKGQRGAFKI